MVKPRKRVRRVTVKDVQRRYAQINRMCFSDSLPKNVTFGVDRMGYGQSGECARMADQAHALLYYKITFSKAVWNCGRRIVFIVLQHEMLHLAAGLHVHHDETFEANKRRLIRIGAYDNLL